MRHVCIPNMEPINVIINKPTGGDETGCPNDVDINYKLYDGMGIGTPLQSIALHLTYLQCIHAGNGRGNCANFTQQSDMRPMTKAVCFDQKDNRVNLWDMSDLP